MRPTAIRAPRPLSRALAGGGSAYPARSRRSPALAFWVTALRELLEETGLPLVSDRAGHPIPTGDSAVAARVDHMAATR